MANLERNRKLFINKLKESNNTIFEESPNLVNNILRSTRFGKASQIKKIITKLTPELNEYNAKPAQRLYHILNNIYEIPTCKNVECNNLCKWSGYFKIGYNQYCSSKCCNSDFNKIKLIGKQSEETRNKRKQTMIERYGVDNPMKSEKLKTKFKDAYFNKNETEKQNIISKRKQTVLLKYNVENISQCDQIKEKKQETYNQNYGYSWMGSSPEELKKRKETNNKKFGVDFPMQLDCIKQEVSKQLSNTMLSKHYDTFFNSNWADHYVPLFSKNEYCGTLETKYLWKCLKCNTEFYYCIQQTGKPKCPTCYPTNQSMGEQEIFDFCLEYFPNTIRNSRKIIPPYEIDIYIPEINLGIEFNGLYYHSEQNGKDEHYHVMKLNKMNLAGKSLIQIFEDEWYNKKEIVKSILLNKFKKLTNKIAARKCILKDINNNDACKFLDMNHIQGKINGKHIGLYYNSELVSILTYGKSRFEFFNGIEIYRFCSKLNTIVNGGLSKLIKELKEREPNIITYVDLRYGNGNGYKTIGFEFISQTPPNFYYFKNKQRFNRFIFQKHKLKTKFKTFNPQLTGIQNLHNNGFYRIWDCGNLKLRY